MKATLCSALVLVGALAAPVAGAADATPAGGVFAGLDRAQSPGTDFFEYANGQWLRATAIPPDRSTFGVSDELQELTDRRTADLVRSAAGAAPGTDARRVGDYFASLQDEAHIESLGLAPLKPALDAVAAISDRRSLSRELGLRLRADVDVLNATNTYTENLFGLWVAQDMDQPTRYLPFLLQGGLGMPDRDYYLQDDAPMAGLRAQYEQYIAKLLQLAGSAQAPAQAARIVALETAIARVHASRADAQDIRLGNNHWRRKDFTDRAPGLDWEAFFAAAGLGAQEEFVAWEPGAIAGMAALVASEPVSTWKEYLRFHTLNSYAPYLPRAFVQEHFDFHQGKVQGTPQLAERWKRAMAATNAALGEAVGRLYVEKYFPPSEKARAEQMVRNLIAAFDRRIDRLDWMAAPTKQMARAKLATLKVGVGYPNRWRDYTGLEIVPGDAIGNRWRAEQFELHRNLAKLGQPVDREEWVMTPQRVDAVNLPVMNAIQFPAAILQPPFFSPANPPAVDYGATGGTIGHEISHSFDDTGAQFDDTGRLHNWWTPDDAAHFAASGAALARQYDGYEPFAGVHVHGKQTLGENIADLAGLAVAYDAYRLSLGGSPAPVVEGFSGDQQFFLGYAQSWRGKSREPALREQIITDVHAPERYRCDTVRNLDAWYEAFAVQSGQALYLAPAARVRIW